MKNTRDVTIYDVAKALDISPSTVSRGLKDHPHIRKETVKKIKAAADRMGYRRNTFASNLRLRRTNTLGLLVPRLNSYFMSTVIAGIEKVTNEQGYGLIISVSQESVSHEIAGVHTLFNSRVDGLMVSLASDTSNFDHFNVLYKKNIPVIFFDRVYICPGCLNVVIDNVRAGYEVTSHLIEQGCRRIVHVSGSLQRNVYADRHEGYRNALRDAAISYNKQRLILSDLSREAASETVKEILKMNPLPDGIFTSNDTSAVQIMIGLQEAGLKIPEDICVAGFNNEPVTQVVRPNLTTVDYPAAVIGEIVANALINTLKNKPQGESNTIIVDHKLIVRESSLRNK